MLINREKAIAAVRSVPAGTTCRGDAIVQALRALPVSDGVTDEMVNAAARALCENMTLTEDGWHRFVGAAHATLEAALGPLPAPPTIE